MNVFKILCVLSLTINTYHTSSEISQGVTSKKSLDVSTKFPSVEDALEFINLSAFHYYESCQEIEIDYRFPKGAKCEYYKRTSIGTEAMIVTSHKNKYIGVLLGASDELRDWFVDAAIIQVPFGPPEDPIEKDVLVHMGFNDALFYEGEFYILLEYVKYFHKKHPSWRIFSSGHSLGGGLSQLMAAGISHYLPHAFINNPSYGTPRAGGKTWYSYINKNLKISNWRYVYDDDIVPRLLSFIGPEYFHVGHTFQLNTNGVKVYYTHYGDESLDYAGVPKTWNSRGLTNTTKGWDDHEKHNYIEYFEQKSMVNPEKFWADEFVECTRATCYDDNDNNALFSIETK